MADRGARRWFVLAVVVAFVAVLSQGLWANPSPSPSTSASTTTKTTTTTSPVAAVDRATQAYDQGVRYADLEDFQHAVTQFENAVSLRKDYAEAFNMLGFSYRHLGDYRRALTAYKSALRLKPDFAEAHEYIGEAYLGVGDLANAMRHYMTLQRLKSTEAVDLWTRIVAFVNATPEG